MMLEIEQQNFIGIGIYTVRDAARLASIPPARVRRWVAGYEYETADGVVRESPPLCSRQLPDVEGETAIGFLDLIELRMVDALRKKKVSWKTIRRAHERACSLFQTHHPFATRRFRTDGRRIFTHLNDRSRGRALLDVAASQYAFAKFVNPSLSDVEFDGKDLASRWVPTAGRKRVVLDPARSFGQPIVKNEGVPTLVLANAVKVEGSDRAVAKWYRVDLASVRAAVAFEKQLAA